MIDMATYSSMHSYSSSIAPSVIEKQPEFEDMSMIIEQDAELTDKQLLLLPPTTSGYSLREKKWSE